MFLFTPIYIGINQNSLQCLQELQKLELVQENKIIIYQHQHAFYCFKMETFLLSLKSLHDQVPEYFKDLWTPHEPGQILKSVRKSYRAFIVQAFKLWNDSPAEIRFSKTTTVLKSLLRTLFFQDEHFISMWILMDSIHIS